MFTPTDDSHGLSLRHPRARHGGPLLLAHRGGVPARADGARDPRRHAGARAHPAARLLRRDRRGARNPPRHRGRADRPRPRTTCGSGRPTTSAEAGLQWEFEEVDLGEDAHPNTAIFDVRAATSPRRRLRGASVGGGRIEVTEIDGFAVSLGGDYHTLVILAHDEPGTIATVAGVFAQDGVNLATMRVDRTGRHQDALMTIEADEPISDEALEEIRRFPWLRWARRIEKIACEF
jgi:hypothetical protein